MTTTTETHEVYRGLVAQFLDDQAGWRERKAFDYPEDQRNARSAAALHEAAGMIRNADASLTARLFDPFVRRETEYEAAGLDIDPQIIDTADASNLVGRFYFDNGMEEPQPSDDETVRLVLSIFDALVEADRDQIGESLRDRDSAGHGPGGGIPPRSVVEFFEEMGYPLHRIGTA